MNKALLLIFLIFVVCISNIVFADNSKYQNNNLSIYLNDTIIDSNTWILKDGEIYMPFNLIKEKYSIFSSWNSTYIMAFVNDVENKRIFFFQPNRTICCINDYYAYEEYNFIKIDFTKTDYVTYDKMPFIDINGIGYISINFLNNYFNFAKVEDENVIKLNRPIQDFGFDKKAKELFDLFYKDNIYVNKISAYDYFYEHMTNKETTYITSVSIPYSPKMEELKKKNQAEKEKFEHIEKLKQYIGKTFWIQKYNLYNLVGQNADFNLNIKDINNTFLDGKNFGYFIKMKIEEIIMDDEVYSNNLGTYKCEKFIVTINNKKYKLETKKITEASEYSYEIFEEDPTKIFKWSKNTWDRMENDCYWIGMTCDMAIMSMGRPNKVNRSVGSWGVDEQWVYEGYNYDNTYLYFRNGKLTSWQD